MAKALKRRTVLMAGAAAVAAASREAAAQAAEIRGMVSYQGGAAIPAGRLEIRLDGAAGEVRVASDGKATAIPFTLPTPAGGAAARVTVRLERAEDGWLLARGSAAVEAGSLVAVVLNTVMY